MKRLCLLLLLLHTLCACQWIKEDFDDEMANATRYINITISVSADNTPATRAPQGGEYGDGNEQGIEEQPVRENYVEKITLIFYQDETGINTNSDNAKVVCVKTYEVHPIEPDDLPNTFNHTHKETEPDDDYALSEIYYSTGDQKLEETQLEAGETYKVLVVANANVDVATGEPIKNVREKSFSQIYIGTGLGIDAEKFVMTSESDATITLVNPTINTEENKATYYSDCIHIERLAARIDYCTKNSTYSDEYGGYVYVAKQHPDGKKDLRVVTKVTSFNLYNEPEYLFKRVRDIWTANQTPTIIYLGDERTNNYVVDPHTVEKTTVQNGQAPNDVTYNAGVSYNNRLVDIIDNPNNSYMQEMASATPITDHEGFKNVIIAYPRENTLLPQSLFKWYATGVIFEVVSYKVRADGSLDNGPGGQPQTKRYYHFLRHQGDANAVSYQAKELKLNGPDGIAHNNEICGNVPMRCGIVRNNIYRISIASFSEEEGTITLTIEEEKWRHVDNPPVYI